MYKLFNLLKIKAFLLYIITAKNSTSIIKTKFFLIINGIDRNKLVLEFIAIKGIELYAIKDIKGI
jgi:hypothetical protein